MKKLIYTFILLISFSLIAQPLSFITFSYNPDVKVEKVEEKVIVSPDTILIIENTEEDNSFDFDTKDYLPEEFDAYKGMYTEDVFMIEEESFDFNTKDYLPEDFNAYEGMYTEDAVIVEEEAFDFDTENYLPENFDAYNGMFIENIDTVEDEIIFDFDTKDYLPKGFDANKGLKTIKTATKKSCEI